MHYGRPEWVRLKFRAAPLENTGKNTGLSCCFDTGDVDIYLPSSHRNKRETGIRAVDGKVMTRTGPEDSMQRHTTSAWNGLLWACAGLVLGVVALVPMPAYAQISCTGTACSAIPITAAEFNQMYYDLQDQYTEDLFKDMAEAGVVSNLMGPAIGTVNLTGITFGASLGAGYKTEEKVDVNITGVGSFDDLPRAGAAVGPRIFLGVNLGWLLGSSYDPYSDPDGSARPPWYSLTRVDVYVSGLRHTERIHDEYGVDGRLRFTVRTQAAEVRYHLLEGRDIFGGPLLRFRGVSLGVGYISNYQKITYTTASNSVDINLDEGVKLEWDAPNLLILEYDTKTYPIELRTGVQLLYFLNLTAGLGYAFSTGDVSMFLFRYGPVIVNNSVSQAISPDTYFGMTLEESGSVPARIYYGRVGVEINVPVLKIGVEAVIAQKSYGATAAVRFEF